MPAHRISLFQLLRLALCTVLPGCTGPDFGDSEAGLALEDLATGGKGRLAGSMPSPRREPAGFTTGGETRTGDVYHPPRGARAGIVLVAGAAERGWRDPRVVAMANTLARLDFTVLVPDLPGVRRLRMRGDDVREVADAVAWFAARPGLAPPGHLGVAGFSYGAGPVLLAAMEPDVRGQVGFVLAVGGYYSITQALTFLTTGRYGPVTPRGADRPVAGRMTPHPYGVATFIRSTADLLEDRGDRDFFQAYARWLLDPHAESVEPLPGRLSADGRALHDLVSNHDPARVPALLEGLPGNVRDELAAIDPAAADLQRLQAHLVLLHGRGDTLIPYTESIALANAVPPAQADLFLIDGLAHVNFRPKLRDVPRLLDAMDALLALRAPREAGPY